MTESQEKKHWLRRLVEGIAGLIVLAVVFIGAFNGLTYWIDSRIKAVVTDEAYVRRVAAEIRPSVVFDNKGSIIADQGAMRYLDNIEIAEYVGPNGDCGTNFPLRIIVSPKQHLAYAPILTCLDGVMLQIDVERGKKFDWVYRLHCNPIVRLPSFQFRLELLQ